MRVNWLPALELYGEGIFFTLDEDLLQRWEGNDALRERADAFAQRYVQRAGHGVPELDVDVSPRFLLCHTLAHLMIRELDAEAGYPAASLKERIYCETGKSGKEPMAGILIYVAVPDEEGSLGGLMELAKPERFLRLLNGAFEAAILVLAGSGLLRAGRAWAGSAEPRCLPCLRARAGDELSLRQRPP